MRILFLDIDTLRPDHLGCYGYHRNTSPNIDSIAARGMRFNNYYCSDAPCLPSRTALMSGRHGIHTGVVSHGGTAADVRLEGRSRGFQTTADAYQLPFICRRGGLRTVCISPFAERHSSYIFYSGFNEMVNTGGTGHELAHEIAPHAIKWINENGKDDNWYLHLNMWDAHTPYRTPLDYPNVFADDPIPDWLTEEVFDAHKTAVGSHTAPEIRAFALPNATTPRYPHEIHDMDGVRAMMDGYDLGIRYADDHVGMILDALREQGVLEDTTIIISADHGENMGEWGIYGEHATADHSTCHIPFIFTTPGGKVGESDGLHLNIDLLPTLADIFGIEPYEKWDGASFKETVFEGTDTGHENIVIGQCAHGCQRSVRYGDYMYIRTYQDGWRLLKDELLYNIKEDPHQLVDLSETMPELRNEMARMLMLWHDDMMRTSESTIDPMWTVLHEGGPLHANFKNLQPYLEWLRAQGRAADADALEQKYAAQFGLMIRNTNF